MAKKKRQTQWTSSSGVTYVLGSPASAAPAAPNATRRSDSGHGDKLSAGTLADAAERIRKAENGRHHLLRTIR